MHFFGNGYAKVYEYVVASVHVSMRVASGVKKSLFSSLFWPSSRVKNVICLFFCFSIEERGYGMCAFVLLCTC